MERLAKSMVVAGVMSGTSADGVDVALVRVSPGVDGPRVKGLGFASFPYSADVRATVLRAMDAKMISVAELSRLNWRLGQVYAECVAEACRRVGVTAVAFGNIPRSTPPGESGPVGTPAFTKAQRMGHSILRAEAGKMPVLGLVALHGQTIYHQGTGAEFLGETVRATWQIGEAAVVAERLRVPVVSDFRPADLAAGGQGAPLVPMLDYTLYRHATKNRVLLNLGGIANVSAMPAGAGLGDVMAFDTGPANCVCDQLMERFFAKRFDEDGALARSGKVLESVAAEVMRDAYFAAAPPKSCGREEFGAAFVERLVGLIVKVSGGPMWWRRRRRLQCGAWCGLMGISAGDLWGRGRQGRGRRRCWRLGVGCGMGL